MNTFHHPTLPVTLTIHDNGAIQLDSGGTRESVLLGQWDEVEEWMEEIFGPKGQDKQQAVTTNKSSNIYVRSN